MAGNPRSALRMYNTANVLDKLPKSQQPKAKRLPQEIWMAGTKKGALAAFDAFVETWGVKYKKVVECLIKYRDALLAFHDFPAEHGKHCEQPTSSKVRSQQSAIAGALKGMSLE